MAAKISELGGILIILFSVLSQVTVAEEFGRFEELSLKISSPTRSALPYEAIPITITVSNETSKAISGHTMISPGYGFTQIYVATDEGFEKFDTSDWPSVTGIAQHVVLRPDFERSTSGFLHYAHGANLDKDPSGQYLLEAPGAYRIKAVLTDMDGTSPVESNVIRIAAREPTGQDADAYKFLKALKDNKEGIYYGNFLMATRGRSASAQARHEWAKKEEFLSKFPRSRHARYVYYSLGRDYLLGVGKGVEEGKRLLEKAASYKDPFIAEKALRILRRTNLEREQAEKAKEYAAEMARRFPDSPEGRDYLERFGEAAPDENVRENDRVMKTLPLALAGGIVAVVLIVALLLIRKKASTGGE